MKKITFLGLIITLGLLGATTAKADAIHIETFLVPGGIGNPVDEADFIKTYFDPDLSYTPVFLFKIEDDDDDPDVEVPGALDGSSFSVSPLGLSTATISWDLTGTDYLLKYILLKDGNYDLPDDDPDLGKEKLYSLYDVTLDQYKSSGEDQTVGFPYPGPPDYIDKGVSHISFFGDRDPNGGPLIPEPSSLLLIGTGILWLGVSAYRRKNK